MGVAGSAFAAALEVINAMLGLYVWILVIGALLSWLVGFGIINAHNQLVRIVGDFCFRLTEPVLARLRRFIPPVGGIDLSPMVLIFAIMFLQSFIRHLEVGL